MKTIRKATLAVYVVLAVLLTVAYSSAHEKEDTGHHKLTITIVYNDVNDKEAADIARRINSDNKSACKVEVKSEKIDTQYSIGWTTGSYSVTQNNDGTLLVNPTETTEGK